MYGLKETVVFQIVTSYEFSKNTLSGTTRPTDIPQSLSGQFEMTKHVNVCSCYNLQIDNF